MERDLAYSKGEGLDAIDDAWRIAFLVYPDNAFEAGRLAAHLQRGGDCPWQDRPAIDAFLGDPTK